MREEGMNMVRGCGGFRQAAGVLRPSGPGPFPVLVAFRGGGGFSQRFLDWAGKIAGFGYVVLVGCWLAPHPDSPPPVVSCSLPPFGSLGLQATRTAVVLVDAARGPGVRANDLGLVGFSAGGTIATLVASSGVEVRAVVAIAGDLRQRLSGADPRPIDRVSQLTAPVLLLHGKKDVTVDAEESIVYEQGARAGGTAGGGPLDRRPRRAGRHRRCTRGGPHFHRPRIHQPPLDHRRAVADAAQRGR